MPEPVSYTNLARTFNTAKRYAEEILFPKMELFQDYQKQASFGHKDLEQALYMDIEMREIQRYNGLKAMNDVLYALLTNISSTVRINKKNTEIGLLNRMMATCEKLIYLFDDEKENFFIEKASDDGKIIEVLNRPFFYKVKNTIEKMYINCEILMTKNKLLFSENRDEIADDKEILKSIKEEYTEG